MKKKSFIAIAVIFSSISVFAQIQTENFESNSWGWTETSSKDGEAIIIDGVFHLEGKRTGGQYVVGSGQYAVGIKQEPSFIETHCFAGFDPTKNFEIKCSATIKKISDNGNFGLILDYHDDGNFIVFQVRDDEAWLVRYKDSDAVGRIRNSLKQKGKKQVTLDISVKSSFKKLQFYINGMMVVEARYLPLETNGIGFYVGGNQSVDFDNVEITQ
jgi:hypothetical protein